MFKIKHILSIIAAVIFSLTITADALSQNNLSQERSERLEQSLYYGLSSEVDGIVESTLFNMLNYKIVYPEFYSDIVMEKAEKIAEAGSSGAITAKASLVIYYYQNQEVFPDAESLMSEVDHMDQDRIFEFLRNGDFEGQYTSTQK